MKTGGKERRGFRRGTARGLGRKGPRKVGEPGESLNGGRTGGFLKKPPAFQTEGTKKIPARKKRGKSQKPSPVRGLLSGERAKIAEGVIGGLSERRRPVAKQSVGSKNVTGRTYNGNAIKDWGKTVDTKKKTEQTSSVREKDVIDGGAKRS